MADDVGAGMAGRGSTGTVHDRTLGRCARVVPLVEAYRTGRWIEVGA
ncbi:hypothetical protein [Geodermatophilus marinus]|nr:hypothetical protein [Geodermatophilus sp. LHW52908]